MRRLRTTPITSVLATVALSAAPTLASGTFDSTPAQRAIAQARSALTDSGATAEEYVALAAALSRRARETADPRWYDRSDAALAKAETLMPDAFSTARQRVWNQLGRHEFTEALEGAKALNERAKDDPMTYGLLVDAYVELGRYARAEEAAQWMLNLRPGAPAAMTRVSYLREQFGDVPGAIEAMRMAFHSTRPSEAEDRAWILTHLAHLELERGKSDAAMPYVKGALDLFPDYHYALKELARVHAIRGEHDLAVAALERRYGIAPHPENLYDLGLARRDAGQSGAAAECFERFEASALEESQNVDNANLQLIEYWLDVAPTPDRIAAALELASARASVRQDVQTLEALAWAQFHSGDAEQAWESMRSVLAVGSKNARVRYRAGVIAEAIGLEEEAERQFECAWSAAPESAAGEAARGALR